MIEKLRLLSVLAAVGFAVANTAAAADQKNIYIVGQDLDGLRGYYKSACCIAPNGTTAYLSLYSLLDRRKNFGGLGVNRKLKPFKNERGWGAGPVNAWTTATAFSVDHLAIGLSITEDAEPDGLLRIGAGAFDPEIKHLARFAKATGKVVLLRIGYEFDGHWNAGYGKTKAYVAAWRHIAAIMRRENATNVQFVWQSATSPIDDILDGHHEDIGAWYPGDDVVDWVGASWFLPPDDQGASMSHGSNRVTMRPLMDDAVQFARLHKKRVMIAELAPQGFDLKRRTRRNISPIWDGPSGLGIRKLSDNDIWQQWYQPFFDYLKANDDVIDAIAYINVNWDSQPMWGPPYANGYWGDSRLETNAVISSRWNAAVTSWRDN